MKYLASYCLLALAGKSDINENDISKVLKEIGAEANVETAKVVVQ